MERKVYPSDITREQFACLRPMLENAKHQTAPRKVDLYDIFCAILYLLKQGCTWRALPGDLPRWTTVRYYFDQWSAAGEEGTSLLERALKKSGEASARGRRAAGAAVVGHRGRAKREEHGHGAREMEWTPPPARGAEENGEGGG